MTMWFDAYTTVTNVWTGFSPITGGITFGAIDTSKFEGSLVRVPNARAENGDVGVYVPKPTTFSVDGETSELDEEETTRCLVDSGAHGDSLPFDYAGTAKGSFFNATGLVNYDGVVAYKGNCSDIPADFKLSYTFAGIAANETVTIEVPLRNYAMELTSTSPDASGLCLLSLELGGCVLGATWLSGAFLALDDEDKSIGLAQGGVSVTGMNATSSDFSVIGDGESF